MGTGSLTQLWEQLGQSINGDAASDTSGFSVSLSADGTRVAIGAPYGSINTEIGETRVYEYDETTETWSLLGGVIEPTAPSTNGERFGYSVSLSDDGNRVAIGSPFAPVVVGGVSFARCGKVRGYEYNGTAWIPMGGTIDGEGNVDERFGWSVSLSGDGTTVAGGAPYPVAVAGGDGSGTTVVYEYNEALSVWVIKGGVIFGPATDAGGGASTLRGDQSGWSVSLNADGTRVAIGSPTMNFPGARGMTQIYDYDGGAWTKIGDDINGDDAVDHCGQSVSLSADGTRVAIGFAPPFASAPIGQQTGKTKVYEYNGTAWVQIGGVLRVSGQIDEQSGYSVSLSADGTTVAIGAPFNDNVGESAGKSAIFKYNEGSRSWDQLGQSINGDEAQSLSGSSVSLSGNGTTVAVGAPGLLVSDTGKTKVYELVTR